MSVLKQLASAEAECVIERLTTWARLRLQDKDHISDEVWGARFYSRLYFLHAVSSPLRSKCLNSTHKKSPDCTSSCCDSQVLTTMSPHHQHTLKQSTTVNLSPRHSILSRAALTSPLLCSAAQKAPNGHRPGDGGRSEIPAHHPEM